MFGLLVLFLFSGVFTVGTNEKAVVTRFGRQTGPPAEPGLHFAWPYPIDAITKVNMGQRTSEIDAFWLRLSDVDKTQGPDAGVVRQLRARPGHRRRADHRRPGAL